LLLNKGITSCYIFQQTNFDHNNHKFNAFGTKTFARYDGVTPVIVTKDPEVIKSVLVKNFDSFSTAFEMPVRH
jgi:hypothetical protein